ncbi:MULTISPECIES: hypothetical protein [Pseudomonas]|jgi:hypothetical protein|uniref:Uncharacterized protein n=4 Tax=Pseudomonas TaxID=286 RepID=A0A223Q4C6_PSEPU|nr:MULTISPECIES: hypothetical protein [Pseudomonas]AVX92432.1 hypothetical protein PkP19E3_30010 [Pseudomonas koreensis]MCP8473091.1 hypothetical protein [Pseudomonas triclosanedens]MCP8479139.1 hypothetical protein [Pseudomonas triclosanedens]WQN30243.1 hypothetical protein ULE26_21995 [Stutzerimonas stutzeri]AGL46305.1 hypothetical protein pOZ176_346 [Pseudomonas aeruginosa PA96]
MISIRDKKVFESADEVQIEVHQDDIHLAALGQFTAVRCGYGGHTSFTVIQEDNPFDSKKPLLQVKEGYNTLAWFTSEVEANKLLARLREVFLEIRAKQEENYRHEPDSITVKVIKRSIEWIGIVLTALVIAFVGGMTAYPGWKMGEGLYHSVINSSETSDGLSFDSAGELLPPAESPEADSGLEPNQPSEPLPAKD